MFRATMFAIVAVLALQSQDSLAHHRMDQQVITIFQALQVDVDALQVDVDALVPKVDALLAVVAAIQAQVDALEEFRAMTVRDSTGKRIGPHVGDTDVLFKVDEQLVVLRARPDGFVNHGSVRFLQLDCTGTLSLPQTITWTFGEIEGTVIAGALYLPLDPNDPGQFMEVISVLDVNGNCVNGPFLAFGVQGAFILDLDAEFMPPFSVDF